MTHPLRLIWSFIALIFLVDVAALFYLNITPIIGEAAIFFYAVAGCLVVSAFYHFIRRDETLMLLGQTAAQLLSASAALGLLSYLAALLDYPLADKSLIAMDRALGFQWVSFVSWVNITPPLPDFFHTVYVSSGPQILILLLALFWRRDRTAIMQFVCAYIVTSLIVIGVSAFFPAMGGYAHYALDPALYSNIYAIGATSHSATLLALREHDLSVFTFPMRGVVMFPSFHCALSMLLIYASLRAGAIKYLIIPLNIAIWFSAPAIGGHYATDIIMGIWLAVIAWRISLALLPTPEAPPLPEGHQF